MPSLVIIGDGIRQDADLFLPMIDLRCDLAPAALRNNAGIIGAACLTLSDMTNRNSR
jgi:polyphosphate glucokinase